jgi:hypothetical protein
MVLSPPIWLPVSISFVGHDASALAEGSGFVCALRIGLAKVSGVPTSSVILLSINSGNLKFPVTAPQNTGACSRRLLNENISVRSLQMQSTKVVVDAIIDVTKSTLSGTPSTSKAFVKDALESTFLSTAKLDVIFSDAIRAGCDAQKILPAECPNRPSVVMQLESVDDIQPQKESTNVNYTVIWSLIVGFFIALAIIVIYVWVRKTLKPAAIHPHGSFSPSLPTAPPEDIFEEDLSFAKPESDPS